MKIFIIDTNVIWSTAYNSNSNIGQLVMSSNPLNVQFYAPEYLKGEMERHFNKIVRLSNQSEDEVREVLNLAYEKIEFISDDQIPFEYYQKSLPLVRDVDMDDLVFVALTEYMDELLWTGDTELYDELIAKGYKKVVNFKQVQEILLKEKSKK